MSLAEVTIGRDLPRDFSMLEIGLGSYPFFPAPTVLVNKFLGRRVNEPNPNFDFSGSRHYVGVDNGTAVGDHGYLGAPEELTAKAREKLEETEAMLRAKRPECNIDLIFGDVFDLCLPSNSFDEVFMSNVLSSMIDVAVVRDLVKLSAKVLRSSGLLVTRETFTPQFMPHESVLESMYAAGFTDTEAICLDDQRAQYDKLTEHYGATVHDSARAPSNSQRYFCIAVK